MTCNCQPLAVLLSIVLDPKTEGWIPNLLQKDFLLGCRSEGNFHPLLPALLIQVLMLQGVGLCLGFRDVSFLAESFHRPVFPLLLPFISQNSFSWSLAKPYHRHRPGPLCPAASLVVVLRMTFLSPSLPFLCPSSRFSSRTVP